MSDNIYLGSNELRVVFGDGIYYVLEEDEKWGIVFTGHYEECIEYCEKREIRYQEAIVEQ